jgi:addiction module HigA family antidote
MATKNPVHSGTVVREDCLNYLDLSVTERAKRLWRWVPDAFQPSERKAGVSIEIACRLSKAFGSTSGTWLGMQMAFELAQSRDLARTIKVKRVEAG